MFFQRLWAICDLIMGLLVTKTVNYELKEFPSDLEMPSLFYAKHPDPAFVNNLNYLPVDMVPKAPKRTGGAIAIGLMPAAAVAKKVTRPIS